MKIRKSTFKTFLGVCALAFVGAGVCQEYILNKGNRFENIKYESTYDDNDSFISCKELINYEIVEMRSEDETKLFIAKANSFNDDNHKIYYDVFTGLDIIGDNEDSFVLSTPIEYYLYGDNIKNEYTKEDLVILLNDISKNYDYEEAIALKKMM